jgi:coenzyme PQQ synthesis protein D (PqqD)
VCDTRLIPADGKHTQQASGIAVRRDIAFFPFDGGMVLLDPRTHRLFAYNSSAALVWDALRRTGHVDDAATALGTEFGISREQSLADVSAIVEHWRSSGLLFEARRVKKIATANRVRRVRNVPDGEPLHGTYRIGNRVFSIHIAAATIAHGVEALLQPHLIEESPADETIEILNSGAENEHILKHDGVEVVRTTSFREITGGLFHTILSSVHPEHRWLTTIHGSSVALDGRAALLAGTSGSGKSTLAAFLVARGFTYVSDDMIAVTQDGRLAAWPVPLSIKEGSWSVLSPHFPELDAIASKCVWDRVMKYLPVPPTASLRHPIDVAILVFPKFDRAVSDNRLVLLQPMEALRRLISDRIWLGHPLRTPSVKAFLKWLAQVRSYELTYGSFEAVEGLLRKAMESRS